MAYTISIRDPNKAYKDNWLWVPKKIVSVNMLKRSLTVEVGNQEHKLWRETDHHLGVPRERLTPKEVNCEIVDLTPKTYKKVGIKSLITLDAVKPHLTRQRDAYQDMMSARGGVLNLACVGGDTVLSLNREGKGFSMTIEKVYERLTKKGRYAWDLRIPTKIRSLVGGRIGLNDMITVLDKGEKPTITISLSNGNQLTITEDHRVKTPYGWVPAGYLRVGMQVITDGCVPRGKKAKRSYRRLSWYPHHPFVREQTRRRVRKRTGEPVECPGYQIEEHRVVMEAYLNGLSFEEFRERCRTGDVEGLEFIDPAKFHVHHKDGDIENNAVSNLEMMKIANHNGLHNIGYAAFGIGVPLPTEVSKITKGPVTRVYDVVCDDPHHNFVGNGVVLHNCGLGKTVLLLHHFADLQGPALVVTKQTHILHQWKDEILGVEEDEVPPKLELDGEIGWIQGKPERWRWKDCPITLGSLTTLAKYADQISPEMSAYFKVVVWDELHHLAAKEYARTAALFLGKRIGATATVNRPDGGELIYLWHVGPVFHSNLEQDLVPEVVFHPSYTRLDMNDPEVRKNVTAWVSGSQEEHMLKMNAYVGKLPEEIKIARGLIDEAVDKELDTLVLSTSVEHIKKLGEYYPNAPVLYAKVPAKKRLRLLKDNKLSFATVQLLKEAADKRSLENLIILVEFSSANNLQQSIGRALRDFPGKRPKVTIVHHLNIPEMRGRGFNLQRHFRRWGMEVTRCD